MSGVGRGGLGNFKLYIVDCIFGGSGEWLVARVFAALGGVRRRRGELFFTEVVMRILDFNKNGIEPQEIIAVELYVDGVGGLG